MSEVSLVSNLLAVLDMSKAVPPDKKNKMPPVPSLNLQTNSKMPPEKNVDYLLGFFVRNNDQFKAIVFDGEQLQLNEIEKKAPSKQQLQSIYNDPLYCPPEQVATQLEEVKQGTRAGLVTLVELTSEKATLYFYYLAKDDTLMRRVCYVCEKMVGNGTGGKYPPPPPPSKRSILSEFTRITVQNNSGQSVTA